MIELFLNLSAKIIPLYFVIFMGYLAGKYFDISRESLGTLAIYFFVPIVMFHGVMTAGYSIGLLFVPIIVCLISCCACLTVFYLSRKYIPEKSQANLLGLVAGTSNSGYFGIPIAMVLFDERGVGIYITVVLGMTIFQNTLGYYISYLGSYTAKESLHKLVKLPVIYAFLLGAFLNGIGLHIPEFSQDFFTNIRGAYVIIGMMIIGAGISQISKFSVDIKFTGMAMLSRHVIWPIFAIIAFYLDKFFIGIFDEQIGQALILASIVPLGADTVAIAAILRCHPQNMATSVLISSIVALIYIPIIASLLIL